MPNEEDALLLKPTNETFLCFGHFFVGELSFTPGQS